VKADGEVEPITTNAHDRLPQNHHCSSEVRVVAGLGILVTHAGSMLGPLSMSSSIKHKYPQAGVEFVVWRQICVHWPGLD
jgi:hypothetical protein